MPPADDGWGKIGVLMVLLALAFAGGVAYFIATSESSEAETAEAEAAVDETAAAAEEGTPGEDVALAGDGETEEEEREEEEDASATDTDVAGDLIALDNNADAGVAAEIVDAGPDPLRANGELDRPTGLVSMSIESEPTGAQVIRKSDGVRLGVTPYRYEVEASGGSVTFLLKLDGHKSMSVPMPADRDSVRQVMLFPGKGGEVIPAPPTTAEEPKVEEPEVAGGPDIKEPADKSPSPSTAKKKAPLKRKAPTKPRGQTSRPKKQKTPKKSGGTVDYKAEPIPLD
jgi:hypothetical protein